jgi:UDP-N-acetylmuramoyl-L-alanyl-D-glutamate--2,6-diaminopimelate ligase
MRLQDLCADATLADIEIRGLAIDSRMVKPGDLFAAFPGSKTDGAAFIDAAIAQGARAILASPSTQITAQNVVILNDANPRRRMAEIAARFYPVQPEIVAAVTGTNGKTSVAEMCRQIWKILGYRAASIGTLGILMDDCRIDTGMTSPDVIAFQRTVADLAAQGCTALSFEASSHALDQYRVHGARIQVAGFTNLTRDHLDYHGTLENYGAAKEKLFSEVLPVSGVAVLNMDDPFCAELAAGCNARGQKIIRYGVNGVELKLVSRDVLLQGQHLKISWMGTRVDILLPLVGAFQAANVLCAAGMVIGAGADSSKVFAALAKLQPIPGRLENVGVTATAASIYVDYAHTPDGLRAALEALRPHTKGRLHVVFGCGGDRDRGKRPEMGKIAAALADTIIITDDNPRTENAEFIRSEVQAGVPHATVIGDRRAAIAQALNCASAGDIVLIAGKGHETGQTIGTVVHPFNDGDVVRELVQEIAA